MPDNAGKPVHCAGSAEHAEGRGLWDLILPEISIKKATLINAVSKYSTVILNIIFTAILSRILTPADYGVVAIVTVFTTFFSMLANLGFGTAVIQDKTLTDTEINHIFSFTLYIALGLVIIFCLFGFLVAWFYQNNVYIPICIILSVSLFFNTINMMPNAVLLKEKRFLLIGIRLVVVNIITYVITIILALYGFKYYALVIQSVLSALCIFIWNLKNTRLHVVFKIDFNSIKKIREYSGYQFGFNVINYFCRNLDKLIIGKVMGDVPLAQYDKAYRMMLYPYQSLTHVITPALHPILSDYQDDQEFIYQKYMRIVKFLSLLGVFITAVCFWCGEEIIILVFGDQWHDAVAVFKALSLSIGVQMINGLSGTIFQSLGDTRRMFQSAIINTAISVIAVAIGVFSGSLKIVAICLSINFMINFFITSYLLLKFVFIKSVLMFLKQFIPELFIFGVIFIVSHFMGQVITTKSFFIVFGIKAFTISMVWFILVIITKQIKYFK
jgi:PST family polysaccharide transporter